MDEYKCSICGYIYNPKEGDKQANIPENMPFEELPDDWYCPVCGIGKEDFLKVEE